MGKQCRALKEKKVNLKFIEKFQAAVKSNRAAYFIFANAILSELVLPRELSYLSCSPELLWLAPMLSSSLLMFVDSTFRRILMRNLEEPKTLIIPRVTK